MRRSRDRNGNITYFHGSGLWDIAATVGKAATSETAKKIGKAAAEKAIVKGSEDS